MTLKERISKDYIEAFKNKDVVAKNLLSVIKGEISKAEKNTKVENLDDRGVLSIISKMEKSTNEMVNLGNTDAKIEMEIIQGYLPLKMSKEDIEYKINELINKGVNTMPLIMKEFSTLNADKKLVSDLVREILI